MVADEIMELPDLLELKQSYMDKNDPTEWSFAMEHFEDWDHWMRVRIDNVDLISHWKLELALKLESEGIALMRENARTKQTVAAIKYLADRGWEANLKAVKSDIMEERVNMIVQDTMHEYANDLELLNQ